MVESKSNATKKDIQKDICFYFDDMNLLQNGLKTRLILTNSLISIFFIKVNLFLKTFCNKVVE